MRIGARNFWAQNKVAPAFLLNFRAFERPIGRAQIVNRRSVVIERTCPVCFEIKPFIGLSCLLMSQAVVKQPHL